VLTNNLSQDFVLVHMAAMTEGQDNQPGWDTIKAKLPVGWKELAVEMGLIRPRPTHLGAKVTDIEQVLRPVLHHVTGVSLRMTTALSAAAGLVSLSAVALHKWMCKLGPYLAVLLARMLETDRFSATRWAGYQLVVGDATTVQRPGATGTTARVHYALTLPDLRCRHREVTDDKEGETARRFPAEAGELWIFDRAYSNPPSIAWIHEHGAAILVRYCRGSLPLFAATGDQLDVDHLVCNTVGFDGEWERPAFVHGPGGKIIEGRLCWVRLPAEKAEEARERVRREHGERANPVALQMAEFIIVFTTVPSERLSVALVLELYRARWQVELEFKREKSIGDLDLLPNFRPDTIHAWICANLLLQEIARRIATPDRAFPPSALRAALVPPVPMRTCGTSDFPHRHGAVVCAPGRDEGHPGSLDADRPTRHRRRTGWYNCTPPASQ
jgi:hypothetical protein